MTKQDGFTLLEVIIAVALAGIIVVIYAEFIATALHNYTRGQTKTTLQANTKQAVETVARDIRAAKRVQANNANPDDNAPGAPADPYSWASSTGSGSTLVLGVPARDASGNLLYIDGLHTSLYLNDVIFYIEQSSKILYRRTIKNALAPNNVAITTCPEAEATPTCPADAKVVEDVADLSTLYLDANNGTVSSPTGTEAVKITLTQTQVKGNFTYTSDFTTIASLRNK